MDDWASRLDMDRREHDEVRARFEDAMEELRELIRSVDRGNALVQMDSAIAMLKHAKEEAKRGEDPLGDLKDIVTMLAIIAVPVAFWCVGVLVY